MRNPKHEGPDSTPPQLSLSHSPLPPPLHSQTPAGAQDQGGRQVSAGARAGGAGACVAAAVAGVAVAGVVVAGVAMTVFVWVCGGQRWQVGGGLCTRDAPG